MVGEQCPVVPSPSCPSKDERNTQTGGTNKTHEQGGDERNARTKRTNKSYHITSCHVMPRSHRSSYRGGVVPT